MKLKKTYRKKIQNKNILIIGGAGFLGSHLAELCLLNNVKKLIIIDNLFTGKKENLRKIKQKIVFYKKDAENDLILSKILKKHKINTVFNLATIALPFSFKSPRKTLETNIKITLNLLELLRRKRFKTLCHFSSSEVYGTAKYKPMDEKHPKNPTTTYAAGKLSADLAIATYCQMFPLDAFIVRPFNNFGPRQLISKNEIGVIPKTVKRLFYNQEPIIYGNGSQMRDFIYVEDTIESVIKLFDKIKPGDAINICSNKPITIKKLIFKINKYFSYKGKIIYRKKRMADVFCHHGDKKK